MNSDSDQQYSEHNYSEQKLELLHKYLRFTNNEIRSEADRRQDFKKLIFDFPSIQYMHFGVATFPGIGDAYALMLFTDQVNITHNGHVYAIGSFGVYITRHGTGDNRFGYAVQNITKPRSKNGGPQIRIWESACLPLAENGPTRTKKNVTWYGHPHLHASLDPQVFCMSDGRDELHHEIVEGNIPAAYSFINAALHTSGPHTPTCEITYWPEVVEEKLWKKI